MAWSGWLPRALAGAAFAALLLPCLPALAQEKKLKLPAELKPFVPAGYQPFSLAAADLDGDGSADYALVLQKDGDKEEGSRPLLIITRGKDGALALRKRNDKVVYCEGCGGIMGDPFDAVEAVRGGFSVSQNGGSAWRWSVNYKFAYSRRDATWQLVRVEEHSFWTGDAGAKTTKHHVYTPPKDFGKIDLADFDPDKFKGVGPK